MERLDALRLATEAVDLANIDGEPVGESTVVFRRPDEKFDVTDNGESVTDLNRDEAIRIVVENLMAE